MMVLVYCQMDVQILHTATMTQQLSVMMDLVLILMDVMIPLRITMIPQKHVMIVLYVFIQSHPLDLFMKEVLYFGSMKLDNMDMLFQYQILVRHNGVVLEHQ